METLEQICDRVAARFPAAEVAILPNPSPAAQSSLVLGVRHAREIAAFLRDDPVLRLDYCSNVTGVDWPDKEIAETVQTRISTADGAGERMVDQKVKRLQPGCLEAVYHLYSVSRRHGPVVLRMRTGNRTDRVTLPSLTPVWRSCEFQEREIYDLFGIVFDGHPDLRRILMWDAFRDHPMRKDYVEPDDYEWEPTPHDAVLAKAGRHRPTASPEAPTAGS